MAVRRPLCLVSGRPQELPTGDTVAGGSGIADAPNDGDIYVRASLSWLRCSYDSATELTRFGLGALSGTVTGIHNTAFGKSALQNLTSATDCCAFGYRAGQAVTTGGANTLHGNQSGQSLTTGGNHVLIGYKAGGGIAGNYGCTAVGREAIDTGTGSRNTGIGDHALRAPSADDNVAVGVDALVAITSGEQNTAIGNYALNTLSSGVRCTAIGFQAGSGESRYESCYFGKGSSCTGDYQVQLGGSGTTPYAYASLQIRSDARDKVDIRPLKYGLAFLELIPVREFRRNLRESYVSWEVPEVDGGALIRHYDADGYTKATRAGKRYHAGIVAQEVKAAADAAGIDFSGYQNHAVAGGDDCHSVAMESFIPALIKAVQELSARVRTLEGVQP